MRVTRQGRYRARVNGLDALRSRVDALHELFQEGGTKEGAGDQAIDDFERYLDAKVTDSNEQGEDFKDSYGLPAGGTQLRPRRGLDVLLPLWAE